MKEQICECLEAIREQNPLAGILLVLDNLFSHMCEYTRKRAFQLGIGLVFLPVESTDLNPIESVWKSLKWGISPLIIESAEPSALSLVLSSKKLTDRVSFAENWIK